MDAGFLNFHKEEDFTSYFLDSCGDDSRSLDGTNSNSVNGYHWGWDNDERELNGDVALIPMSSVTDDYNLLSSSPPSREDFNKIINDWHQFVNLEVDEVDLTIDVNGGIPSDDLLVTDGFDITKFVEEEPQRHVGGKRIDKAKQRYVIDEEEESDMQKADVQIESFNEVVKVKKEEDDSDEEVTIDVETVSDPITQPVLQAGDLDSLLMQFEATETTNLELKTHSLIKHDIFEEPKNPNINVEFSTPKKLKPELNDSISETEEEIQFPSPLKVDVISPIKSPPKIRSSQKLPQNNPATEETSFITPAKDQVKNKQILDSLPAELIDRIRQSSKRKPVPVIPPIVPAKRRLTVPHPTLLPPEKPKENKSIQLDHDYCSNIVRKDSGFSSCEEDERAIVRSQPTVKNADGKLMVSLLKTNTIKKKLNLEEYKKRLQNRGGKKSPVSENEDENLRRLKHQEMLMKMAQEIITQGQNKDAIKAEVEEEGVKPITPPSNMVMKTLVSVGTNTEESWGHMEQILQNTQVKLGPNSLISSIVEHLPKVKPVISKQVEHGEDKTIVYLDRESEQPKTCTVSVQTVHSSSMRRRRSTSTDSSCSSDSDSSRSRTPSPMRRRHKEQIKEVEERRVIYVGRISDSVTREDLRRRFSKFGPITNVSVHFRRRADNYGFVTFTHKEDAYMAVERGNDDINLPQYDLSFGGRRLFCQTTYSDLDNVKDDAGYWSPVTGTIIDDKSFDVLLKQAQAKMKKRQL